MAEARAAAAVCRALTAFFSDRSVSAVTLGDAEDAAAFASQMLLSAASSALDQPLIAAATVVTSFPAHASFVGQLAAFLSEWSTTERCPLLDQHEPAEGVSVVMTSRDCVLNVPLFDVRQFVQDCVDGSTGAIDSAGVVSSATDFVAALGGARGVLTCLGFRETTGGRTVAPITRTHCLASFLQPQSTREKLTVGARAFTKHCARSSDGFWGELKGNDLTKNAIALARLEQILDSAVWKNVHSLPHGEATLELRNAEGYGARWYIRDQSFRGFLEPHMENGHENRWRH